jgi:diamine N-acetyltransferase
VSDPSVVTLSDVTADTWKRVVALRTAAGDDKLVASNVYSLAEARFNPHAVPLVILEGSDVVGFLMYERLAGEGCPHAYSIYRLMVDVRHRGRGIARAALSQLIAVLQGDPQWERISICYVPGNAAARHFYESLGFKDVGLDADGEVIAEIVPPGPISRD